MLKYMRKVFIVAAMAFLAMGAQAQNLVKNGNFDTPLNNEKTYASIPSTEDWFAFDKTNGATTISPATDDEKHGNAVQIETTTDNSWYKAYLGQRIQGAEKAGTRQERRQERPPEVSGRSGGRGPAASQA